MYITRCAAGEILGNQAGHNVQLDSGHSSAAARQSNADGRSHAGKERQVVGKALSPGGPATQSVELDSRVRIQAPVAHPYEGLGQNMRVLPIMI